VRDAKQREDELRELAEAETTAAGNVQAEHLE
jgi:hypothetical protein